MFFPFGHPAITSRICLAALTVFFGSPFFFAFLSRAMDLALRADRDAFFRNFRDRADACNANLALVASFSLPSNVL